MLALQVEPLHLATIRILKKLRLRKGKQLARGHAVSQRREDSNLQNRCCRLQSPGALTGSGHLGLGTGLLPAQLPAPPGLLIDPAVPGQPLLLTPSPWDSVVQERGGRGHDWTWANRKPHPPAQRDRSSPHGSERLPGREPLSLPLLGWDSGSRQGPPCRMLPKNRSGQERGATRHCGWHVSPVTHSARAPPPRWSGPRPGGHRALHTPAPSRTCGRRTPGLPGSVNHAFPCFAIANGISGSATESSYSNTRPQPPTSNSSRSRWPQTDLPHRGKATSMLSVPLQVELYRCLISPTRKETPRAEPTCFASL